MGAFSQEWVFLNKTNGQGAPVTPKAVPSETLLPSAVSGSAAQLENWVKEQHQREMAELTPLLLEVFDEIADTLALVLEISEKQFKLATDL